MAELKNLIVNGSSRLIGDVYASKVTELATPTATTDAANKAYVDGIKSTLDTSIAAKAPISHASSATTYGVGTTSNYGHVLLVTGDLKSQTAANGKAASNAHTHSQYLTSHQTVTNSAPTLAWGNTSTVGTVGGTALTVKMPANPNTDTLNTAGASNTSSKIYLVGAISQTDGIQTYSHDTAYVGTDGCLYSGGSKVLTSHQSAVTSLMSKTGAITMTTSSETNGTVNFAIDSNKNISGTVYGLGTAAYKAHTDYVTAIGTSGNTLTWSKGGTAQAVITVPYASSTPWSGITGNKVNFYSGSLSSSGWKTLGGRTINAGIYSAYNSSSASWNSATYSASLTWGNTDTRGLLDCSHNTPIVTFGGGDTTNSTDNNPTWYMKLSGTTATTYNLDTIKSLAEAGNWSSGPNMGNIEYACIDTTTADRFAFLPADQIIVEKTTDGGTTWVDYGMSDSDKANFFKSKDNASTISIPLNSSGQKSCQCMVRITVTGMKFNVPSGTAETSKINYWNSSYISYCERYFGGTGFLNFWLSSNADRIHCTFETRNGLSTSSWTTVRSVGMMYGWSGRAVMPSGQVFGGWTSQTSQPWMWRFTFRTQASDGSFDDSKLHSSYMTTAQYIYSIRAYSSNCYGTSNNMMDNGRLYDWDSSQNATFPANVTAPSFTGNLTGSATKWNGYNLVVGSTGSDTSTIYITV